MKNSLSLVLFAGVILAILFFLSSGKGAPPVPADARHASITTDAACTACHAPGKTAPLKHSHPPKEQCLICHKVKK